MIPGLDLSDATGGTDDFGSDSFDTRFGDFNVNTGSQSDGINWTAVIIALVLVGGTVVYSQMK